jgi:undecaprenyl-phosphate 4-deoxy-4-formamido-L-arabinose transferase
MPESPTPQPPSISVVIPVFNGAETVGKVVEDAMGVLDGLGSSCEFLLVNDGSRDRSWEVIEELAARDKRVRGINLMKNYGQHNALLCGILRARCELVLTMDDDGQHPADGIPKLLERLGEGYDVVYGTAEKERHGLKRAAASKLLRVLLRLTTGNPAQSRVTAFRLFRTRLRQAFLDYRSPYVLVDVLLSWGTDRFGHVPVAREERLVGQSNYSFLRLVRTAVTLFTAFSTLPLKLVAVVGFLFTFFGFALLVYVLVRYFIEGGSVPGFPFLASVICIFSGAQLFALGVFGEYLARIFKNSMNKPPYAVETVLDPPGGEGERSG